MALNIPDWLHGGATSWAVSRYPDKRPLDPRTLDAIKTNTEGGWTTLDAARLALAKAQVTDPDAGNLYLCRRMQADERILCVDFDQVDEDTERNPEFDAATRAAIDMLTACRGWHEESASGKGKHVWLRLPEGETGDDLRSRLPKTKLEFWSRARHMLVTGRPADTPGGANPEAPARLVAQITRAPRHGALDFDPLPIDTIREMVEATPPVPRGEGARNQWLSFIWAIAQAAEEADRAEACEIALAWSTQGGAIDTDIRDFYKAWDDGCGKPATAGELIKRANGGWIPAAAAVVKALRTYLHRMPALDDAPAAPTRVDNRSVETRAAEAAAELPPLPTPEETAAEPDALAALIAECQFVNPRELPVPVVPDAIIPNTIPTSGVGTFVASQSAGKSVWALDMAMAVGDGRVWDAELGEGAPDMCSLYLPYEDGFTLTHYRARGVGLQYPDVQDSAFRVIPDKLVPIDAPEFVPWLRHRVAALRLVTGRRGPCLVVVDTIAAAMTITKENENAEVSPLMKRLGEATDRSDPNVGEIFIMLVGHYGKDTTNGQRGASAWAASSDMVLELTAAEAEVNGKKVVHKGRITDCVHYLTRSKMKNLPGAGDKTARWVGLIGHEGVLNRKGETLATPILLPAGVVGTPRDGRADAEAARAAVNAIGANVPEAAQAFQEYGNSATKAAAAKTERGLANREKDADGAARAEATRVQGDRLARELLVQLTTLFNIKPGDPKIPFGRKHQDGRGDDGPGLDLIAVGEALSPGHAYRPIEYAFKRGWITLTAAPPGPWGKKFFTLRGEWGITHAGHEAREKGQAE